MGGETPLDVLIYNPLVSDRNWEVASFRAEETCHALSQLGVGGVIASPGVRKRRTLSSRFEVVPVPYEPAGRLRTLLGLARSGDFCLMQERMRAGDFTSNGYGFLVSVITGMPLVVEFHIMGTFDKMLRCFHFLPVSLWRSTLVLSYLAELEGYMSFGIDRSKIVKVPNGYSKRLLNSVLGRERDVLDLHQIIGARKAIGFFGAFEKQKGVDLILDAARELRNRTDLAFVFAGTGPLERHIASFASRSGSNIVLLGLLTRIQTIACMAQCIATFAMHNSWEARIGNPVKVVESLALGVPVIIPSDYNLPVDLKDNCIQVTNRSPRFVADAVVRVLEANQHKVAPNGFDRYSIERIASDVIVPAYKRVAIGESHCRGSP